MINQALVALHQTVDGRRCIAGPDDFDIRHGLMVHHRQIDALKRIPTGGTFTIAQGIEIEEGLIRPFDGKAEMMKCQAGAIDPVGHGVLPALAVLSLIDDASRCDHSLVMRG